MRPFIDILAGLHATSPTTTSSSNSYKNLRDKSDSPLPKGSQQLNLHRAMMVAEIHPYFNLRKQSDVSYN